MEGLPLAIELAAAATRYYSCAQIAGRIEERRQVLVSAASDVAERQRSITATFAYSWDLLVKEEQHIFAGLSVFRGGFDEEAAQAVTEATAQQLWSLADKSLLRRVGEGRYDMHTLLRQFAAEKRHTLDGREASKRRHLAYYVELAEAGERALRGGEELQWLERLEVERPNFNAALTWGLGNAIEEAARLASANWLFWFMHTHLEEGQQWYERILRHKDVSLSPRLRARALNGAASMALARSSYDTLQSAATEGLRLMQQLGDEEGISLAFHHLSGAAQLKGDNAKAIQLREEGLQISRAAGDRWLTSIHLQSMAIDKHAMGLLEEAEVLLQEHNALAEECGRQWSRLYGQYMLAEIKLSRGQALEAGELFLEALPLVRKLRDRRLLSWAMYGLGRCAFEEGRLAQADGYLEESLRLEEQLGRKEGIRDILLLRSDIAARQGNG